MSDIEEDAIVDTKFQHKKSCSKRIFIGPWDIKAPLPSPTRSEQLPIDNQSILSDSSVKLLNNETFVHSDSSIKAMHKTSHRDSTSLAKSPQSTTTTTTNNTTTTTTTEQPTTPSSGGTSFLTARSSKTESTMYHSVDSSNHFLDDEREDTDDDEIDYNLLNTGFNLGSAPSTPPKENSDTESIQTIKPSSNSKGKLPMNTTTQGSSSNSNNNESTAIVTPPLTPSSGSPHTRKKSKLKRIHRSVKKPLAWKKRGSVFVSRIPTIVTPEPVFIPTGRPIKREPILCMRSVKGNVGSEPSRYKASKEARFDLLTEEWRQVELVLSAAYISTYSSSTMFWPQKRLEHRIYLQGSRKPKRLELVLLSPLDYSFCLRYLSNSTKMPMIVTMTFKARSFLKCQEWYMQLYNMLPNENKRPMPEWCQVYIPTLDFSVNLPLNNNSESITMEDVKEAVITVLEDDGNLVEKMLPKDQPIDRNISVEDLGLCWTTQDRAEWIYWKYAASDPKKRIDLAICPQSIEGTHRLELRMIEHTPHNIVLRENMTLKEPPPVEGFLVRASDFNGTSIFKKRTMNYFASFDQYLFYIPASKVTAPNMACFIDEDLLPRSIQSQPYVSAVSPYTSTCTSEIEVEEIRRRMQLMTEASGIIDLTEVSYVKRTFSSDLSGDDAYDSQISLTKKSSRTPILSQHTSKPSRNHSFHSGKEERAKPCLEIVMENGLQIKFEVYSSETCDLWVSYLAQIIVYWKARKEAEKDAHSYDNAATNSATIDNKNALIKTGTNTEDGCVHKKQEKLADTRIWSYCLYEQCRDVVKAGVLYCKPNNRGTYSQKICILTANGWFLLYDVYNRETSKKTCNHEKKSSIDIAGCYFYSGMDSSRQKKGSNQQNLLRKDARIYSNGLSTNDDILSCIFSIWKPKLRRYFSPKRQRLRVYHHDQRLNPKGNTWTFLARSRSEKEEWVCCLNTVTEHMIRCEAR